MKTDQYYFGRANKTATKIKTFLNDKILLAASHRVT